MRRVMKRYQMHMVNMLVIEASVEPCVVSVRNALATHKFAEVLPKDMNVKVVFRSMRKRFKRFSAGVSIFRTSMASSSATTSKEKE